MKETLTRGIRSVVRRSRESRRWLNDISQVVKGTYRPMPVHSQLSLGRLGIPSQIISIRGREIYFTCDYLPDRYSFSETSFWNSPHVDFAIRYYAQPHFGFEETEYYKLAIKGRLPYPVRGVERAVERCERFVQLLDAVRENKRDLSSIPPVTMVECRDGNLMVVDGKHRLAAYIALSIEEFPVVLCFDNELREILRASKERARPNEFYARSNHMLAQIGKPYAQKQDEIAALREYIKASKLESWAEIYHPIPFNDFADLSTQVEPATSYTRLGMILAGYQDFRNLRVLDMGCNVGFYSFSLAKRGATVTGVDARPEYIEIASRVANIYDLPNATFINSPITPELINETGPGWDIALCFSMIQWVADQRGMEYACEVLKAVSKRSKAMFFDVAVNSGAAAFTTVRGGERRFVEELLREETEYTYVACIGDVHPYKRDTRHVFYCHQ